MLGLKHGTVKLVSPRPYYRSWQKCFANEADNLRKALDMPQLHIEHVGSTSMGIIDSKPILDMLAATDDLNKALDFEEILKKLDYELATSAHNYVLYVKGPKENRTHHLSFAKPGEDYWEETILFRNYLKKHRPIAEDYEDLKRKLAKRYPNSRRDYTLGKAEFIHKVLDMARAEQPPNLALRSEAMTKLAIPSPSVLQQ
ncbi:MAG: GrpB family protein [Deinococcales bacterium]